MAYLNEVKAIGTLTKTPELRFQPSGQALVTLDIALNRKGKDANGQPKTDTTYLNDVEVWGPPAQAVAKYCVQGSLVLIDGRLKLDKWEDKATGQHRSRLKIVAHNVQFLRTPPAGQDSAGDPADAGADAGPWPE